MVGKEKDLSLVGITMYFHTCKRRPSEQLLKLMPFALLAVGIIVVLGNLLPCFISPFSSNTATAVELHGGAILSKTALFRFRILFVILFLFTINYEMTVSRTLTPSDLDGWLKFFTNWSWLLVGLTSSLGALLSQTSLSQDLVISGKDVLVEAEERLDLVATSDKDRDMESGEKITLATHTLRPISKAYVHYTFLSIRCCDILLGLVS